ncbi:hypothetical protein LXH13_03065 [Streptomyces spinosirectus]|uniref:Rv1733c family protein n=1 Tax=Streptomyces TaxID=1883 RepID=UPI001C9DE9E0|nr:MULTISPECIES: hypothetical protein [Streptomyces]MBY8339401.1 hypothetical protein [Streptomyces plumbidurans]UIR16068.1 hypothetical protein LXH13_03065 [Streptomyces spinosirectus]
MRRIRRVQVLGWRWRRNPLRRRSDVLEAWIVLAAWAVATLGAVVAGIVGAQVAQRAVQHDRAERRPVSAVLVKTVPGSARDVATGVRYDMVLGKVRWTDAHGVVRTGTTQVKPAARPGSAVPAWTDGHGRLVSRPVAPAEATTRVVMTGTGVALATGALVLVGGHLMRMRVERRATLEWGVEWDRIDRRRGHTTG